MEAECVALFEVTAGIVLANYSAQNVDRLVTIYRKRVTAVAPA